MTRTTFPEMEGVDSAAASEAVVWALKVDGGMVEGVSEEWVSGKGWEEKEERKGGPEM